MVLLSIELKYVMAVMNLHTIENLAPGGAFGEPGSAWSFGARPLSGAL
jgi:hypothetical protein